MNFISIAIRDNIAIVTIQRGKVNAINLELARDLQECLDQLRENVNCRAIVLTGNGKFFSFGFDLPELLTYDREQLREFLTRFISLKSNLFTFEKPMVAAINGHATAGGCMLALTADYRIMIDEGAKIALNEVNLGVQVFAGTIAMLSQAIGMREAEQLLLSGDMYTAEHAFSIGLVDRLATNETVLPEAIEKAKLLAAKPPKAFTAIKLLLRRELIEQANAREPQMIEQFMDHWFSEATQRILKSVEIRK